MQTNPVGAVYSNAFNFSNFVSTGVDPRTGQYTVSLSLGEIRSAALNGPTLPLTLSFNPLSGEDAGYGTGWSLNLTRYNSVTKVLTLSTGERFKAIETVEGLRLVDQKLQCFRVVKQGNGYRVLHKDGTIEELAFQAGSYTAVSIRIIAANGVPVILSYTQFAGQPTLASIQDHQQRLLLVIERPNISNVILKLFPDSADHAEFRMTLSNQLATTLALPAHAGQWTFQYELHGGCQVISRVITPTGASESLQYKDDGHQLPPGAPVAYLPHVISHLIYPGQDQPAITKTYQFSDRNFLGFGVLSDWSDDGDNLYRINTQYDYRSTERIFLDSERFVATERIYNHCHLQTEETIRQGAAETATLTTYHLDATTSFLDPNQPAYCQLPKRRIIQYRDGTSRQTRQEVVETDFDDYGNLLKHVDATGVTTEHTYYPREGEPGCPADPSGFVRSVKRTRISPARGEGYESAPAKETQYQYQQMSGFEMQGTFLLTSRQQTFEQDAAQLLPITTVSYQYLQAPMDAVMHGRLHQHQLAVITTANDFVTTTTHDYAMARDTLTLVATLTSYDGLTTTQSRTISAFTGLEQEVHNPEGMHLSYRYDALGRVVSETSAPGTAFEASRQYVYTPAVDNIPASRTTIDINGMRVRHQYDGLGRVIRALREDTDEGGQLASTWRLTEETHYNTLGQIDRVVEVDWITGNAIRNGRVLTYDEWGHECSIVYDNGVREHIEYDPIARATTQWLAGQGKTVTRHNAFDQPIDRARMDSQGNAVGKIVYGYDGFGRTCQETDAVGNQTRYQYDAFDRLTTTTLPDGSQVETSYAPHTVDAKPVSMQVNGQRIGEQTFDGLGRLVSRTVGGRQHVFQYRGGAPKPAGETTPDGTSITYQYQPELEFALIGRRVDDAVDTFQYQPRSAQLTVAATTAQTQRREYYPSGLLRTAHTGTGGEETQSSYRYSLNGRPLSYTGIDGGEQLIHYDEFGRAVSLHAGSLRTTVTYDVQSRPAKILVKDQATDVTVTTIMQYDDFGREVQRTLEVAKQATQTLSQCYTATDKISRRTLRSGDTLLRDEHFDYDPRGRLTSYQCAGPLPPTDSAGKRIVRQIFAFDALDNIVRAETVFPDGANTATYAYADFDPTQLVAVTNSHPDYPPSIRLDYDAAGNLLKDERARQLQYDALGRLQLVTGIDGNGTCHYGYDATDRLIHQTTAAGPARHLHYRDGRIAHEIQGTNHITVLQLGGQWLGQYDEQHASNSLLLGTDRQQSPLSIVSDAQIQQPAFTPYGDSLQLLQSASVLGFNGERIDRVTGCYQLGNGCRTYNPRLMRFHSPDSLSPFSGGGLNPYAYCLGDPINHVDPTGQLNWKSILGIVLGAVGVALAVVSLGTGAAISAGLISAGATLTAFAATGYVSAGLALAGIAAGATGIASAALSEKDSNASNILGWVSLGLGIGSSVLGGLSAGIGSGVSATTRAWAAGAAATGVLAGGADAASKLLVDVSPLASEILSWVSLGLAAGAVAGGLGTTRRVGHVSRQYGANHFPDAAGHFGTAGSYQSRPHAVPTHRMRSVIGDMADQLAGWMQPMTVATPTEFRRIRELAIG
ncbi:RHS repeat-associated core domain-containing protein [Chitinivorax sp. B]|uniref:RHS repeat domain-containing protein n=1 Tax=Chitinivorax sp. B TaxID=2502235 RepID=UPI0010F98895|nr:RHS repeat-associated core domain-containing protein [Chitinivorax sp. B]